MPATTYMSPSFNDIVAERISNHYLVRELFLPLEFWNYTFHLMRMTDAILPGHTSPGTIKGSANHARSLFSFLPDW